MWLEISIWNVKPRGITLLVMARLALYLFLSSHRYTQISDKNHRTRFQFWYLVSTIVFCTLDIFCEFKAYYLRTNHHNWIQEFTYIQAPCPNHAASWLFIPINFPPWHQQQWNSIHRQETILIILRYTITIQCLNPHSIRLRLPHSQQIRLRALSMNEPTNELTRLDGMKAERVFP